MHDAPAPTTEPHAFPGPVPIDAIHHAAAAQSAVRNLADKIRRLDQDYSDYRHRSGRKAADQAAVIERLEFENDRLRRDNVDLKVQLTRAQQRVA